MHKEILTLMVTDFADTAALNLYMSHGVLFTVDPANKLSTTWANIKAEYYSESCNYLYIGEIRKSRQRGSARDFYLLKCKLIFGIHYKLKRIRNRLRCLSCKWICLGKRR